MDAMVTEVFELYRLAAVARSRNPSGPDDLSETEFLTLDTLSKEQPLTIGEVQKQVGVVPAQMSRIVRALEEQGGKGYLACRINVQDRRRIDLSLTETGREAYNKYRNARLSSMYESLNAIPPEDRFQFMRIVRQIHSAFKKRLNTA